MEKTFVLIIIPVVLVIYFEFLGRWFVQRLNISNLCFYFPIGFFLTQAITYPLSILTNLNGSFYVVLVVYIVLFFLSIYFIIKDYKPFKINILYVFILLLFTIILTLYSINTTLGDLDGFDTIHYLNMTSQNIGLNHLNSKDVYLNGPAEFVMTYYSCETYYYFAGALLYILGKLASLLSIEYYYSTTFIWVFQILFNLILSSIFIEIINRFHKKPATVCSIVPLLFVFGKLYYNNVFGFYGNSLYTLCLSYGSIYLIDYLGNKSFRYLLITFMCLFAACSFTSSGIYTLFFVMMGSYFFAYDERDLFKIYSLLVLFPLYNAMNMERHSVLIVYFMPIVVSCFIYLFGEKISLIIKKKNLFIHLIVCLFLIFFVLSRFYSTNIFDFSGLLNNFSQNRDMTLNYFTYNDQLIIVLYKLFIVVTILFSLVFNYKKRYIQFILILIIVLFNPFCCNFINHYIRVYYRAYDIFINPFSIAFLVNGLLELIKHRKFAYSVSIIVSLLFIINTDFVKPLYYHEYFIPDDTYNNFYKMSEDQINMIRELQSQINYNNSQNPYIITDNIFTQSMIPNGKYLIGKAEYQSKSWSINERRLFEIFYPTNYLGKHIVEKPDYQNMKQYLADANIDYLVVDRTEECFDEKSNNYISLEYMIYNQCKINPVYENESYVLYYLK